jgi:fibronectin-binding autotransporter adhesin
MQRNSLNTFVTNPRQCRVILLAAVAALTTVGVANAAPYVWDPGQTPAMPSGGTGPWDTTSLFWANGGTDFAWPNTSPSPDTATFGGTAGTVTVAASPTIDVNAITFNTAGYTVTGGTLNFSGVAPTVTKNADATLTSTLTGSGGLTLNGAGAITINNASNSLSGGINLNQGTLNTSTAGSLGTNLLTLNGGVFNPNAANLSSNNVLVTNNTTIERHGTGSATLGTLSIGAQTLTIKTSSSVSNGNVSFGATTLTGNATVVNSKEAGNTNFTNANATFSTITVGNTVAANSTTTFTVGSQTTSVGRTRAMTVTGALSDNASDPTKKLALTLGAGNQAGNLIFNLNGISTYTGNTTVTAGTLNLNDNAGLKFDIGATGVNNSILGAGTVNLNGDFTFDLTDAASVGTWNIVNVATLTESFGTTFQVNGFTDADNDNVWTFDNYSFSEATGVLTASAAVPEPASLALLGLGGLMALRRRVDRV